VFSLHAAGRRRGREPLRRLSDTLLSGWSPATAEATARRGGDDVGKKKGYLVPFGEDGSLLQYCAEGTTSSWQGGDEKAAVTWKAPDPFHAILQVDRVTTGRNSVTVWWKNSLTGAEFPTSVTEFNRVIKEAEWQGPLLIDGLWQPVKRGQAYLLEYVPTEKTK
jgi:hypothetical protein